MLGAVGGAGHHEHRALLGVLGRIGQHGGRYDPSTVKHRDREGERDSSTSGDLSRVPRQNQLWYHGTTMVHTWLNYDKSTMVQPFMARPWYNHGSFTTIKSWLYHASRTMVGIISKLLYWGNRKVTGSVRNIDNVGIGRL